MNANTQFTGNRPTTKTPIKRTKHPTNVIVQRSYGHRPANDKLQEENKQLRQRLADLDLRLQLASNNPGSTLYPSVRDYLAMVEKITLLEHQLSAATDEEKPAIDAQIEAMHSDYFKALDAMTVKMREYIERRIAGKVPRIPLMTVEA